MTITSVGSERVLEQIIKQLDKLIDVVEVYDSPEGRRHARECALLRLRASERATELVDQWLLSDRINIDIIDKGDDEWALAVTTDTFSLERLLESLDGDDLLEISRSGALAVASAQADAPGNGSINE